MEPEEFCLKWNNHHNIFMSVLNTLFQKELLVDVTLAAEGKFIEVHRLVLCACSQYFEDLLSTHKKKQSIIFLSNVTFSDLQALVEYMYQGEVNVTQAQLPRFLAAAEALQIKGLTDKCQPLEPNTAVRAEENVTSPKPEVPKKRENLQKKPSLDPKPEASKKKENSQKKPPSLVPKPLTTYPPSNRKSASRDSKRKSDSSKMNTEASEVKSHFLAEMDLDDNFISVPSKAEADIDVDEEYLATSQNLWPSKEAEGWTSIDVPCDAGLDVSESSFVPDYPHSPFPESNYSSVDGILRKKKRNDDSPDDPSASAIDFVQNAADNTLINRGLLQTNDSMTCPRCRRHYTSRSAYLRHKNLECGVEPKFGCSHCTLRFKRREYLKYHLRHVHSIVDPN